MNGEFRIVKEDSGRGFRAVFYFVEAPFNKIFGADNPFYHLGDLGFYFFYIMVISGIYLFFYYEPTVVGSFDALQRLTQEQWFLGGIMRSMHRYAADAMVAVMALHMLREWVFGRFRGARWFSWFTGAPLLIMVYLSGIVGFWMVWDELGQFIAVRTSEWLDWLPIFASPMARNFLLNTDVTDLFFRLLIVLHIGIPLFLLAGMLVHIKRVSRARIMPPRALACGTLIALLLLSLLDPVSSQHRADLGMAINSLNMDWFYLLPYPLVTAHAQGVLWVIVSAIILLLLLLPWLPPRQKQPAISAVNLDYCSGCGLCADDCPYEAIDMRQRSDAHPLFLQEAHVIASNCVSCGICTGSCPSSNPFRRATTQPLSRTATLKSGIEMPQYGVDQLRRDVKQRLADMPFEASVKDKILLLGCDHGVDIKAHAAADIATLLLPCIGMLPPAFIEHSLQQGASGVLITGCRDGDCYHRLGNIRMAQRIDRRQRPFLRRSVDRSRIGFCQAAPSDMQALKLAIDALRQSLTEYS